MTALAKMAAALGSIAPAHLGLAVRQTFECMDVVEQEIARALRLRSNAGPDRQARLRRAFLSLLPPQQLLARHEAVYRSHARELLERAACGRDLRPGTDAEVLCCMLDCSLVAPPTALVGLACTRLFERVFSRPPVIGGGELSTEPWPGAVVELVEDLRHKTAVPTRKLKDPEDA